MAKECATIFPSRMREMSGGYEATRKQGKGTAVRQAFSVFDDTGIHPDSIVESRKPRMIAPSDGSELRQVTGRNCAK